MVTQIWVNIDSGNALLPDGTKLLPHSMLTYYQWGPLAFSPGKFHRNCSRYHSLQSYIFENTSTAPGANVWTHWGRVTHVCVGNLIIISSDNGLSPDQRQAIIWTDAAIMLTGALGTKFSEILIEIQTVSLKKMLLKTSVKWRPFCLSRNVFRMM